ncbi:adhesion G protein-coupled receptor E1-like [Cololabis saira]|uniref:adhesion G protein-coupled receptor E1-like n=1 Tax=Cololabis saira TaxID=129043 RepID=UPI002AD2F2C6|nr:adhesion G protein-coupled receptor E1-like [Cololabis saira]
MEILTLGFMCLLWIYVSASPCEPGQRTYKGKCVVDNECDETPGICGINTDCFNTNGSYYCQCHRGYINIGGKVNFTDTDGTCTDINECFEDKNICGSVATCKNMIGTYDCTCLSGYIRTNNRECEDINECREAETDGENICGEKGTCKNINGSYWCVCPQGYTNYGNKRTPCSELNCTSFSNDSRPAASLVGLVDILSIMRNSCLALSNSASSGEGNADGEVLLEKLLKATVSILSPGPLVSMESVSSLLCAMVDSILLIGPQLKANATKMETTETGVQIAVERGKNRPTGPIHLTNDYATLSTDWDTVLGMGPYPGFAMAALLSYKNLEESVNRSFERLKEHGRGGVSFQVFSKVVSVVASNPSPWNLQNSFNITFRYLQKVESPEVRYICVHWNKRGVWSTDGCNQQQSNVTHIVCSCNHLSSFAVLMALEHTFGLLVVTKIGLIISLVFLALSILTFKFCRSIQGTRTTIHLHLCICLFMADLVFLTGISQINPEGGCRFVAALLHFFFLGVFAWMLLEGVQLYRMVVLVFNATIRPLYLYLTGYGTPLAIIIVSAIIRPKGYGTDQHCWLSLKDGLIWSFFGPVCVIIVLNVCLFIVTGWKLAQKFTSVNTDLSKLQKTKAFAVTAIGQMSILHLMRVFGSHLFQEDTTVVVYIFTVLNSLQGILVFIILCLLSKQVRDEYVHFLSCICTPQKSSSESRGSRSGRHTQESQI